MYLAPKGSNDRKSILQHLLSHMGDGVLHHVKGYLTTRAIKKAVKFGVFREKQDPDGEDPWA